MPSPFPARATITPSHRRAVVEFMIARETKSRVISPAYLSNACAVRGCRSAAAAGAAVRVRAASAAEERQPKNLPHGRR